MFINVKAILGLPVITESGTKLGSLKDMEIDIDLHFVRVYQVSKSMFHKADYEIGPSEVVKISTDKIVVKDAVLKEDVSIKDSFEQTVKKVGLEGA
jgi:sporulation protein YlmC with PRC-barrel domain